MADKRIKGITIEIGGETTGLQKAMSDVTKKSISLTQELKDVERLLKFDPSNVEALAQKQRLLADQVEVTSNKLKQLKDAEEQVQAQFKKGDITEQQYRAFRREIEFTEGSLGKLKSSLASVNNGAPLKGLKKDAKDAEESVNDLGGALEGLAGTLVAGGGIAGTISSALDTSSIDTKIDISFDVPEESRKTVKDAIKGIEAYGVEGEAALEGVRRQWTLNKNASDESNAAVVKYAGVVASSFAGIDFTELIQETNEVASGIGATNEEAIALINSLLKAGFPPEQLDTIAEYGMQMKDAGFSVKEIQSIFEQGINTKTWNIDNLNDGVKEARIQMSTFGQEIPKSLKPLIQDAGLSVDQFQKWGKAVTEGGDAGAKAMSEVATWLDGIEDKALRNEIATTVFGTKWEDQGQNMISVFQGTADAMDKTKQNADSLNQQMNALNADPAIQLQQAIADLKTALEPLLLQIAEFVAQIAIWVSENPKLAATITAVVTAVGILIGLLLIIAPIFTALAAAATATGIGLLPLVGIVAGIVVAFGLLVAAGIAIYKNWDEIKAKAIEVWGSLSSWFGTVLESIKQTFSSVWGNITSFLTQTWNNIKSTLSQTWDSIKQTTSNTWNTIVSNVMKIITPFVNGIMNIYKGMKDGLKTLFDGLKQYFSGVWNLIKNIFTGAVLLIVDLVTGDFNALKNDSKAIFENMKNALRDIWEGLKKIFSGAASAIKGYVVASWENIRSTTSSVFNAVKSTISSIWQGIKSFFTSSLSSIKSSVSEGFQNIKSSVSKGMTDAQNKITEIWKSIMSFFKGINLKQIGKDVIQGLINGITDKGKDLVKKAKDIADSIKKTLKNVLDIHSPSRVTREIGKNVGEGLVLGLGDKAGAITKASVELAKAAIPDFIGPIKISEDRLKAFNAIIKSVTSASANEIALIHKNANAERAKVTSDANQKIADIEKKAATQKKGLTLSQKIQINNIERDAAEERAKISAKEKADVAKSQKEISAEKLKALQEYVSNQKNLNRMSLEQEVEFWKQALTTFKNGTTEKVQAQIALNKALDALNAEAFAKEKKWIDEKKYYNQLSLAQELKEWQEVQSRYKKGTEERAEADREVYRLKKQIHDDLMKINEEYTSKIEASQQRLIEGEQKLTEEYNKAVTDRTRALYSFAGIFDEINKSSEVSGQKLIENLQGQVSTFAEWADNIKSLAAKGIDEGLLAELREMGPKAYAEIAALNSLTDEELQQYAALWKEKNALARTQATDELAGLKTDTQIKIEELRKQTEIELTKYKDEWLAKINQIRTGTENELNIMNSSMKTIGNHTIQGLMDGLSQMTGPLLKQARDIANAVKKTIQQALDIHSPSRETMWMGEMLGEGLIQGMDQTMSRLQYMSSKMASAALPNISGDSLSLNGSSGGGSTTSGDTYGDIYLSVSVKEMQEFNNVVNIFRYLKQNVKSNRKS
ncbi:hypothetical protein IHV09_14170 [Fictibacillus sp. 23RED33]|uniref:phage tail protein n=1 Tax=Fictibacillus sp. 23RED33 TaxID=2745879 RepID=UPI0018CE00A8|nr:hypothetical protein [Fictibacillus sp. 23RED33]MBH0174710.1 hypothetical protein [Fictibacillus sp. 23RED33]